MTIENLKEEISSVITAKGCSAEFFFLLDGDEGMCVKSVDINEEDQTELAKMFTESLSNNILLNDDLSLIPISSADDRKNALYEYDLDDIPEELSNLKKIIENEDFDTFSFSDDLLKQLEGVLILIGNQDVQLAIYKHHYPITLLQKDSGFSLTKMRGSNRFQKLDQDILKIDPKFQFIKLNGKYYILDIKALERFFGFNDAIKNIATQGVENIKTSDLVMDCGVFESRLDDITFSRKLVKSASQSPVLSVIPNREILSFTNTHPALKGKFKYSSDGSQFDLKTKKSQNLFLKLLNDDFLQSELTKKYYESVAKDNIEEAVAESAA